MNSSAQVTHYQPTSKKSRESLEESLAKKLENKPFVRFDWSKEEIELLLQKPLNDLIFMAQTRLRAFFRPNEIQRASLLSIKTGKCPEDCAYCAQSAHYKTGLKSESLLSLEEVMLQAKASKTMGASRFCMGAAFKSPHEKDMAQLEDMVKAVKTLGLETCMTLGMLDESKAKRLKNAGLDYYNHNLDTSKEHYQKIVSTHSYQDRMDTLSAVRNVGLKVCTGAILGLGEKQMDRASWLQALISMEPHPESVPINRLIPMPGTPLEHAPEVPSMDFVRTLAAARILMPSSFVRLSAGREQMSDELQALCFAAGANSIFYGDCLLTAKNPKEDRDQELFKTLGLKGI